jgi:hypothetical protein
MTITWRIDAQTAAGNEDDMARPVWTLDLPWCSTDCPHHDGERCRVLGLTPGRLCEPVVKQMAVLLSAGPVKP